jgi:hypothetical protein
MTMRAMARMVAGIGFLMKIPISPRTFSGPDRIDKNLFLRGVRIRKGVWGVKEIL